MKQLGFGTMRLPVAHGQVDLKETEKLFDRFLAAGFTYFDTAYGYHDYKSELAVREALVKRHPRESFLLADKMPVWLAKEPADLDRLFNEQLEKTGAGYFDYYLLHALGGKNLEAADAVDAWSFALKKKDEGLVKRVGFSFHDTPETLEKILSAHPEMEFVQLQINYADWESERVQSRRCYETARRHGKDVIIMEPVRGGSLAQLQPFLAAPFEAYAPDATLASWALRFCASLDGVIMVLSGMSDMAQVEDNIKTFSPLSALDQAERAVVEKVREALAQIPSIPARAAITARKPALRRSPSPRSCARSTTAAFTATHTLRRNMQAPAKTKRKPPPASAAKAAFFAARSILKLQSICVKPRPNSSAETIDAPLRHCRPLLPGAAFFCFPLYFPKHFGYNRNEQRQSRLPRVMPPKQAVSATRSGRSSGGRKALRLRCGTRIPLLHIGGPSSMRYE